MQQLFQGAEVELLRVGDDLRGQCRTGCFFIPGLGFKPVAHVLFIKGGLGFAGSIALERPVAGGIGREYFIDEVEFAVCVCAEFEFCVGEY